MNRLYLSDVNAQIKELSAILLEPEITYMQVESLTNRIAELKVVKKILRDNSELKLATNNGNML